MSDFSYTGESDEDDYSRIKQNIQKIINLTKIKAEEKNSDSLPKDGRRKKNIPTKNDDLLKQFRELKEFEKTLLDKYTSKERGNRKNNYKINKKKDTSSEEEESKSLSSGSSKSTLTEKEFSRKKADTKAIANKNDEDGHSVSTVSEDSVNKEQEQSASNETDVSDSGKSKQTIKSKSLNENLSDSGTNPVKLQTELKKPKLKDQCQDIIEKGSSIQATHSRKLVSEESLTVTDSRKARKSSSNSDESDTSKKLCLQKKTKLSEEKLSLKNPESSCIKETLSATLTEEEKSSKIQINEQVTDSDHLKVKPVDSKSAEIEELNQRNDNEKLAKIRLQILSTELLDEQKYLQKCMDTEKNKTVEAMDFKEKYPLCNKSDDELIRRTVQELELLDQTMKVEKSTSTINPGEDSFQYSGIGDGDKNTSNKTLHTRIDQLQEQIRNLRTQLEEAKQHNQREKMDIMNISNQLMDHHVPYIRNGLEWEEWELKEMVRERLREKREVAALDYQTRLRIVEALCSQEMGKLENALETLLPLNAAASAWGPYSNPTDVKSSWMTQDYFLEVITSMNLSSSDEKTLTSGVFSTNGEKPTSVEPKPES